MISIEPLFSLTYFNVSNILWRRQYSNTTFTYLPVEN